MDKIWESLSTTFLVLIGQLVVGLSIFLRGLALLVIGWIIARVFSRIIGRILDRIGLGKVSEKLNEIPTLQKAKLRLDLVFLAKRFLYWLILLVFVISAADVMGLAMVSEKLNQLIDYLPQVFVALVILGGGFYLADQAKNLVGTAAKSMGISAWKGISGLVFYVILIFVVIAALERLDFFPTEIITDNLSQILGGILLAFAIAYGFAARPVLSGILASYYSRGNFEVGQEVEVSGHRGTIVKIDTVSFALDTGDKKLIFPLSRLVQDEVIIYSDSEE